MRIPHTLLFLYLILAATFANAQQFKVLKDTTDYKLMEVDSGYFYSHGEESKMDFVLDTTLIKKKKGVLKLPLLNGKFKEFKDTLTESTNSWARMEYSYVGEYKRLKLYIVAVEYYELGGYYLIDERNGDLDGLMNMFYFSPQDNYYAYCFYNVSGDPTYSLVNIKCIKTKKSITINFVDYYPDKFKWVTDNTFLLNTHLMPISVNKQQENIYYLVEIKK